MSPLVRYSEKGERMRIGENGYGGEYRGNFWREKSVYVILRCKHKHKNNGVTMGRSIKRKEGKQQIEWQKLYRTGINKINRIK